MCVCTSPDLSNQPGRSAPNLRLFSVARAIGTCLVKEEESHAQWTQASPLERHKPVGNARHNSRRQSRMAKP